MRRAGAVAALLISLTLTAGCPFESEVPIGSPTPGSLDARMFGSWIDTDPANADSTRIIVFPFNDAEYYVEVIEKGHDNRYRAVPVLLAGAGELFQINEITDQAEPDGYIFARCALGADGLLSIRFVGEKIVPGSLKTDPKGLTDFIAAHVDDPALDDEDSRIVLRRQSEPGAPPEIPRR